MIAPKVRDLPNKERSALNFFVWDIPFNPRIQASWTVAREEEAISGVHDGRARGDNQQTKCATVFSAAALLRQAFIWAW